MTTYFYTFTKRKLNVIGIRPSRKQISTSHIKEHKRNVRLVYWKQAACNTIHIN